MLRRIAMMACCAAVASTCAAAGDPVRGAAAYRETCEGCHGAPPGRGAQQAVDAATIRAAIEMRGAMNFLRFLSASEVEDIAAYIRSLTTPGGRADFTDLWNDPAQPGWGVGITHHAASNAIFAVLFVHEPPARATWHVMPGGRWVDERTYEGSLYRTGGPPADRAFGSAPPSVRAIGTARLTFLDDGRAILAAQVDGVAVTRTLHRQAF